MAKYLVTGGAGFIGSSIVQRLVEEGQKVRVIDNLSTGRFKNIEDIIGKIDFIYGDLSKYSMAQKAVYGIDYILHQAAIPSVPRSVEEPQVTNESTVTASINLLRAAVEAKTVKRVVQAASSAAYGNTLEIPKREDMVPNPISPYAAAKLSQEYYGKTFFYTYGIEVLSLRYFNVFGPKQIPNSPYAAVIPKFIEAMLEGISPVIYGDGTTSRDFTYIDNVVDANLLACTSKWPGSPEIINIGCGERISLNELVEMLNYILGTDIKPLYEDFRTCDVKHSLADISKAKQILGYIPKTKVYEGLCRLVEWKRAKSKLGAYKSGVV
jgi:nucleoside-diphosphate-sugar epimerase